MMSSHPCTLCDGWGWYVDTENMRPPSNTLQIDVSRVYPQPRKRDIVSPRKKLPLTCHVNSLEMIKEDPEDDDDDEDIRQFRATEKVIISICSTAFATAIVVSVVVLLL